MSALPRRRHGQQTDAQRGPQMLFIDLSHARDDDDADPNDGGE
jgi:hypothetical protein